MIRSEETESPFLARRSVTTNKPKEKVEIVWVRTGELSPPTPRNLGRRRCPAILYPCPLECLHHHPIRRFLVIHHQLISTINHAISTFAVILKSCYSTRLIKDLPGLSPLLALLE
jgi:hypothetical protein